MSVGGNFSEEKFPPNPFQKTFEARVRIDADPEFYRCGGLARGLVRSTIGDPDLRSPSEFDSGLSPSAQDDTRRAGLCYFTAGATIIAMVAPAVFINI